MKLSAVLVVEVIFIAEEEVLLATALLNSDQDPFQPPEKLAPS
jgi:hypothetical protein